MNKFSRIIRISFVLSIALLILSACGNKAETGKHDIGYDYTISIKDKEYHYYVYLESACYIGNDLISVYLGDIDTTPVDLMMSTNSFDVYSIYGANSYECLLKVRNDNDYKEETLLIVGYDGFSSISELLSFLGVNSADDITSCDLLGLSDDNNYSIIKTMDTKEDLEIIYGFLTSAQGGAVDAEKTFPAVGLKNGNGPTDYYEQKKVHSSQIYKLDIQLSNNEMIPVGLVLPDDESDGGYIEILGQHQYFKADLQKGNCILINNIKQRITVTC